jgi:hypothetical protein
MRSQFETEGWEMPMRRASSLTPPTARIASRSPWSRICLFLGRGVAFFDLEQFETVMPMQRYRQ